MTLYIIFTLIGAAVLLFSLFGGDHHLEISSDAHDLQMDEHGSDNDSPKVLSLRTIASFLLAFGVAGIICLYLGKGIGAQMFWGFLSGFLTVALVYSIMKLFYSQQGYSTFNLTELIGANCVVTVGTTSSGIASVRVLTPDGAREYTCREISGEKLERNDVVIIKSIQDNTVFVSKVKITFINSTIGVVTANINPREIHTPKTEASKKAAYKVPSTKKTVAINGEMLPKKSPTSKKSSPKLSDFPK